MHIAEAPCGLPGVRTIVLAGLPLGVALGGLEVGAPAFALEGGHEALVAVPLAAFSRRGASWRRRGRATAHARAALRRGSRRGRRCSRRPSCRRLSRGQSGRSAAILAGAGVGFGLLNVGCLELLDVVVPERNAVEALTWLTSAEGLELAAGAAAAGALAEQGTAGALAVAAVAPAAMAAVASARRGTLGPAGPSACARGGGRTPAGGPGS